MRVEIHCARLKAKFMELVLGIIFFICLMLVGPVWEHELHKQRERDRDED